MSDKLNEYTIERAKEESKYNELWESVCSFGGGTNSENVKRLKVPGGWIYKFSKVELGSARQYVRSDAITFVPEQKENS